MRFEAVTIQTSHVCTFLRPDDGGGQAATVMLCRAEAGVNL